MVQGRGLGVLAGSALASAANSIKITLMALAWSGLPCSVTSGDKTWILLSSSLASSGAPPEPPCPSHPLEVLASQCPGPSTSPVGPGQARAWDCLPCPRSGQQMSAEAACSRVNLLTAATGWITAECGSESPVLLPEAPGKLGIPQVLPLGTGLHDPKCRIWHVSVPHVI